MLIFLKNKKRKNLFIQASFLEEVEKKISFTLPYSLNIEEVKNEEIIQSFENRYSFFNVLWRKKKKKYLFMNKIMLNSLKYFKVGYKKIILLNLFLKEKKIMKFRFLLKKKNKYLLSICGIKFSCTPRILKAKKKRLNLQFQTLIGKLRLMKKYNVKKNLWLKK